ncbi:MAG TPA: hypothetical protein VFO85_07240 [Vicinamibacteria bacterium]|nr:hypothetical protein [Vicinamibacteria bacterium]
MARLILVPALVTLAVTLLRLTGELLHWNASLFNREAGGGGALIGIVWLIPLFGIWFALKLDRAGAGPERVARALGWAALAFAFNTALGFAAFALVRSPVAQLGIFFVTSGLAIAIARPGWPALWRVLVAYGLAARLPVIVIMFLAIFLGWDSHYAKPRPDFPPMGPWGLFFWTALLPQLGVWIYLTVAMGMVFGAAAVGIRRQLGPRAQAGTEAHGAA